MSKATQVSIPPTSQGQTSISFDLNKAEKVFSASNGQYIIPKDGYVYIQANGISGREIVYVNNKALLLGGNTAGIYYTDGTFLPVKKDTIIRASAEFFGPYAPGYYDANATIWYMPK